jgi:hypothetical protein
VKIETRPSLRYQGGVALQVSHPGGLDVAKVLVRGVLEGDLLVGSSLEATLVVRLGIVYGLRGVEVQLHLQIYKELN